MYEFVRGPLVWLAFLTFFGGSAYRLVTMIKAADKERVIIPVLTAKHSARSIGHWLLPFGARNMRMRPLFTVVSFTFHFCLLVTPLFIMGHAVLWEGFLGFSWWSMPAGLADGMTVLVILACLFFLLRRITAPHVRNVTAWTDYLLLLLVVSPFLTGFIAHQQWLPAEFMLTIHILTGVAWLAAIPFTRLAHMLTFVFTRAYMGSEFGSVRNARDY